MKIYSKGYLLAAVVFITACSFKQTLKVMDERFETKFYRLKIPGKTWNWHIGDNEYRTPSIYYVEDVYWARQYPAKNAIYVFRFKQYNALASKKEILKSFDPNMFEGAVMYSLDQFINWRPVPPENQVIISSRPLVLDNHQAFEVVYSVVLNEIRGQPSDNMLYKFIVINRDLDWGSKGIFGSKLDALVLWYFSPATDYGTGVAEFDEMAKSVELK